MAPGDVGQWWPWGAAGLWGLWGFQLPGFCGKEEGRGARGPWGAESPSPPLLVWTLCSWLQLIPGYSGTNSGSGIRDQTWVTASYPNFLFHVQEAGFSWEPAWFLLILPGFVLSFPCAVLESPGALAQDLGLEHWWGGAPGLCCPAWGRGLGRGLFFLPGWDAAGSQAGQAEVCNKELWGCWSDWPGL